MASFDLYIPLLQQVEGGYQKLSEDIGNYNSLKELVGTNYGISARFYEDIIGRPPSENDIRAITKDLAKRLFKTYFWNAQKGSEIHNQKVANTIIDHQINAGNGVRLAQETLNEFFNTSLVTDNQMGFATLSALNSVDWDRFVYLFNKKRAAHYVKQNNPTFIDGWLKRLQKFSVEYKKPFSIIGVGITALSLYIGYKIYKNKYATARKIKFQNQK